MPEFYVKGKYRTDNQTAELVLAAADMDQAAAMANERGVVVVEIREQAHQSHPTMVVDDELMLRLRTQSRRLNVSVGIAFLPAAIALLVLLLWLRSLSEPEPDGPVWDQRTRWMWMFLSVGSFVTIVWLTVVFQLISRRAMLGRGNVGDERLRKAAGLAYSGRRDSPARRALAVIVGPIMALVFLWIGWNWGDRVDARGIATENPPFGLRVCHPYSQVVSIETFPWGGSRRSDIRVSFTDGSAWDFFLRRSSQPEGLADEIAIYISKRSGKEVQVRSVRP